MAVTNPQILEALQLLRVLETTPPAPTDTTPPAVALLNTPLPAATVGTPYSFTLRITDAVGINESTITASAFEVRRPDNELVAKTITGITGPATQKDVVIETTPGVDGAFTIASLPNLISDTAGNTAAATALGGFTANLVTPDDLDPLWYFKPSGITTAGSGLTRRMAAWADSYGNTLSPVSTAPLVFDSRMTTETTPVVYSKDGLLASMTKSYSLRNFSYFVFTRIRRDWSANTGLPVASVGSIGRHTGSPVQDVAIQAAGSPTRYTFLVSNASSFPRGSDSVGVSACFDLLGFTNSSTGQFNFYENGRAALPATAPVAESNPTSFSIGSNGLNEIYAIVAFQRVLTADEINQLYLYFLNEVGSEPYTTSLTLAGDSIVAGETYVSFDNENYQNRTVCERLSRLNPSWRVGDFTRSSTFIQDGATWMLETGTGNRGGNALHNSSYANNVHVIQHGRNNFSIGEDLATVQGRLTAAIDQQTALGRDVWVCTIIDTVFSSSANYPNQAAFDTAVNSYNSWLRTNFASLGATGIVDFAANAAFTPGTGAFNSLTYYNADRVHPNQAGADLLVSILDSALVAYS